MKKSQTLIIIVVLGIIVVAGVLGYVLLGEEPKTEEAKIGFLGCSITHNAVDGYTAIGGEKFWTWDIKRTYGGGCLSAWGRQLTEELPPEKTYWSVFERMMQENPQTKKIWWELCSCEDVLDMEYEDLLDILNRIKEIAPNSEIYASPMPLFIDTLEGKCKSNLGKINSYVDRMVVEGHVKAGPLLSSLPGSKTAPDGCHANEEGKLVWGQDLMDFFR